VRRRVPSLPEADRQGASNNVLSSIWVVLLSFHASPRHDLYLSLVVDSATMADVNSHSVSPATDDFEMADQKAPRYEVGEKTISEDDVDHDPAFEGTKSAPEDRLNMQRMGKKQQLIV